MLQADAEERARIAGELHDDTVQEMAAILITLDRVVKAARRGDEGVVLRTAVQARATLAAATERARRLLFELRPPLLDASGLHAALRGIAARIRLTASTWSSAVTCSDQRCQRRLVSVVGMAGQPVVLHQADQMAVHLVQFHRHHGHAGTRPGGQDQLAHGAVDQRLQRVALDRLMLAGGRLDVSRSPNGGTAARLRVPLSSPVESLLAQERRHLERIA